MSLQIRVDHHESDPGDVEALWSPVRRPGVFVHRQPTHGLAQSWPTPSPAPASLHHAWDTCGGLDTRAASHHACGGLDNRAASGANDRLDNWEAGRLVEAEQPLVQHGLDRAGKRKTRLYPL